MSAAFPNGRLAARYLRALTLAGGDEHVAAAYTASQRWVEGEQLQTERVGGSRRHRFCIVPQRSPAHPRTLIGP